MNKTELRKYLNDRYGRSEAASPLMTFGNPAVSVHDVIVDVDESDKDNPQNIMLTDILDGIGSGGDADCAKSIETIDGSVIEFFVGEKENYEELSDEDKKDLLAIITNDEMRKQVIDGIEELMAWKNKTKKYTHSFMSKPQIKKDSDFYIGTLSEGKSLDGIVGIGLEIMYAPEDGSTTTFMRFSGNKTSRATTYTNAVGRHTVSFCTTSGLTDYEGKCGTASMNIVVGEVSNRLYFTFENGSLLWVDDTDANSIKHGVERLDKGNFYLSGVSYWFE